MKKIILTSATVLLTGLTAFAQNGFLAGFAKTPPPPSSGELSYQVYGRYHHPVYKEKMDKASRIDDFVDGYPTNWIDEYVSVEVLAINNGKEVSALGVNDKLTAEQKSILKSADLGTDVLINVNYKNKSTVSNDFVDNEMSFTRTVINIKMTVIPETQAEYAGGRKEMSAYLKESVISKIPETVAKNFKEAQVLFTVNEKGEIEDAKLSKSSGDQTTDQLLLDAINKMPKWKPAETAKGVKVKQEFEFFVGQGGC